MKIFNTYIFGWEAAIMGMRNPLNSWDKSDSIFSYYSLEIGENDLALAQRLIRGGSEHSKFLRMIHVQMDMDMPRYFWSEFDTYHFNTKNSCSTMHRLLNNKYPITKSMFVYCEEDEELIEVIISCLEEMRIQFLNSTDDKEKNKLLVRAKRILPEGFLQRRTVDTSYAELRNIYFQRKNHRLKEEWVDIFCNWIESLPYAKELILYTGEKRLIKTIGAKDCEVDDGK